MSLCQLDDILWPLLGLSAEAPGLQYMEFELGFAIIRNSLCMTLYM